MSKDGIDASLGLAFSLELFKQYRKSGLLRSELRQIPGFRGPGTACLELVEGSITASYIEDKQGQRTTISSSALIQLDKEKGPFKWRLSSPSSQPAQMSSATPSVQWSSATPPISTPQSQSFASGFMLAMITDAAIPVIVAPLNREWLRDLTLQQRQMLQLVWNAIDGQRTVGQIKALTQSSIPVSVVDAALRFLIEWKVVVIK